MTYSLFQPSRLSKVAWDLSLIKTFEKSTSDSFEHVCFFNFFFFFCQWRCSTQFHWCPDLFQKTSSSSSKVKLATLDDGNPKAPFSIASTSRCRAGCYSFLCIAPQPTGPLANPLLIRPMAPMCLKSFPLVSFTFSS